MAIDETKMQEIAKRYDELPEDVQEAYFSSATSDAIFEVGKKHGLQIDKMGELADETGLVMLGMTKPSEYIRNLEKRLGIEVTKAKEIAEDINQKVFSPIRESLKKIHGITPTPTPVGVPPPSYSKREGEKGEGVTVPENLPVEITPPQIPPPLTVRGGGEGGGVTPSPYEGEGRGEVKVEVSDKVNQILRDHETAKQARRVSHVMPSQPENIKIGEIAKPVEPKVEVKPMISGRIEGKEISPPYEGGVRRLESAGGGQKEIPDIFLKKIPPKPSNYSNADPYKEPLE